MDYTSMNMESDFNLLYFSLWTSIWSAQLYDGKGKKNVREKEEEKLINLVYSSTCIALCILVSVTLVSTNSDIHFLHLKKNVYFSSISFYFRRVEMEDW